MKHVDSSSGLDLSSLTERVQRDLRDAIISGELQPGSKLPINETATRLGVSSIPLREALRALEAEGLVAMSTHRGAAVAPISLKDMESIYSLRVELEGMAIRQAGSRKMPGWLESVRHALEEMTAAAGGDPARRVQAHANFHLSIYAGCDSPWLVRFITVLYYVSERYRQLLRPFRGTSESLLEEHGQILRWIELGEMDQAARFLQNHIALTAIALRGLLADI
jgi:DNA-binding GntR family transcriptional regulator